LFPPISKLNAVLEGGETLLCSLLLAPPTHILSCELKFMPVRIPDSASFLMAKRLFRTRLRRPRDGASRFLCAATTARAALFALFNVGEFRSHQLLSTTPPDDLVHAARYDSNAMIE